MPADIAESSSTFATGSRGGYGNSGSLRFLIDSEHENEFGTWMERAWMLLPTNDMLRASFKKIYSDLMLSLASAYIPPEVKNTGRINFVAQQMKLWIESMAADIHDNGERETFMDSCSSIMKLVKFEKDYDVADNVNDEPFVVNIEEEGKKIMFLVDRCSRLSYLDEGNVAVAAAAAAGEEGDSPEEVSRSDDKS